MNGKIASGVFDTIVYKDKTYINKEQLVAWLLESSEISDGAIKDTMVSLSKYLLRLTPNPK